MTTPAKSKPRQRGSKHRNTRMVNKKSINAVKSAVEVFEGFAKLFIEKGNHQMATDCLITSNDLQNAIENMKDANALITMLRYQCTTSAFKRKIP